MANHNKLVILLLLVISTYQNFVTTFGDDGGDMANILLTFKNSLGNVSGLSSWNTTLSGPPCTGNATKWAGLRCNEDSTLDKILLDNLGLVGMIDVDTLTGLTTLRTLSLMGNNFEGPLPQVKKLTWLRNLYLSHNRFSGEIPEDGFDGMNSLRDLFLANNEFRGEIPESLVRLPKLEELRLEENQFSGDIPDFEQSSIKVFNVAGNHLDGEIPSSLAGIDASSFAGNNLCGRPLQKCKSNKTKMIVIIAVVIGGVAALIALVAFASVRRRKNGKVEVKLGQEKNSTQNKFAVYGMAPKEVQQVVEPLGNQKTRGEQGKLHFVRNDRERFDLHDLLRASAEVLGSGTFGSSYKAVLLDGPAMVVKRFRQMNNVGKDDFYEHMKRLGKLSHPNLLPLVGFYYRKEEKLLVTDFIGNGSLASHLHGKLAPGEAGLDWPKRLKIVKGVAKGLGYLYREFPTLTLPHGNLKSSNILVDDTYEPLLTDYALVPLVNKEQAQQVMVAYKSPEFTQVDRTTRKTDVWSFGILILEILTGKFPANYFKQGKGENIDLATWVNSVVREEWTGEVFDKEMKGTKNGEGEMLKLLKIGMCCCEWNVERRWDLKEALERIEELKEKDNENDEFSSYASEEIYSSRALTDEDFSFSVNGN